MKKEPTFASLGLSEEIVKAIEKKGFKTPSPIQAGVIPLLLNGNKDIIGQAQTGTGKTAAFALPLLEKLNAKLNQTQAIVLVPTRELAIQVEKEIKSFSVSHSPSIALVYGGNPIRSEMSVLKKNPNIVVGTPGRVQHHIRNGHLNLNHIQYFVLDEADEMLNFGFREEIEEILSLTPPKRRVLLFSATMPQSIMSIVSRYMASYDKLEMNDSKMANKNITQKYYCVAPKDKFEALCRIIEEEQNFYAIVFCRTKSDTDFVASQMIAKNFRAEAIHGDIDQAQREKILGRFRERKTTILVATDVAARGIDITELDFVVNYSLPESYEAYTHRIGRTGRAGNKGVAITLVSGREMSRIRFFERNLGVTLEKGTLLSPKEVVSKKQENLIQHLEHIVNNENIEQLLPLAKQLLEEGKAVEVVAALLKLSYPTDFNPHTYKTILDDSAMDSLSEREGRTAWQKGKRNASGYRMRKRGSGRKRRGN